jgi:hypothetical protein
VPLLFIPFPTILNNILEWTMYLFMGGYIQISSMVMSVCGTVDTS